MTALVLPAPFDGITHVAHIEGARRRLSWTMPGPGEIARNRYSHAWISVEEQQPFKGEPLWCTATRRIEAGYIRQSFTDPARKHISSLLLPPIARAGFDRVWCDAYAGKVTADGALNGAAAARRIVRWWERKAELAEMNEARMLTFRPVDSDAMCRELTVPIVSTSHSGWTHERVIARAVVDGEHVGWITKYGDLVPIDDRAMISP